jgi:hypothetical protein
MQIRTLMAAGALALAATFSADAAEAQVVTNDCYKCIPCTYVDGSAGHRVTHSRVARGTTGLTNPETVECGPGTCDNPLDDEHQACIRPTSTAFSLPALQEAVESGDVVRLAALVRAGGDAVEVNFARAAIQVVGCQDGIVAHLPLAEAQLRALAPASEVMLASAE